MSFKTNGIQPFFLFITWSWHCPSSLFCNFSIIFRFRFYCFSFIPSPKSAWMVNVISPSTTCSWNNIPVNQSILRNKFTGNVSFTVRSHRRRRERQSGRKSFIFNVSRRRAPARAARHALDGESIEESWNQVNFMVMSYDAVWRQPIGM